MSDSSLPTLFILNRNYSSWSLRPWVALRELGVKFNTEVLIIGTSEAPDLHTPGADKVMSRAGPTSKAPAFHVVKNPATGERQIIFESLAILEYLAEDYPSLWPEDRFDRAYARSLASEMATSFGAVRAYAMNIRQSYPFDPKFFTPKTDKELTRLSSIWEELRAKAVASGQKDEGYLFGRFTALDAMYAPLMFRLLSYDLISRVTGSHAQRYVQHMLNSASMKEWEADSKKETAIIPSDELYPDTL